MEVGAPLKGHIPHAAVINRLVQATTVPQLLLACFITPLEPLALLAQQD